MVLAHGMIIGVINIASSASNINKTMKDVPLDESLFSTMELNAEKAFDDIKQGMLYSKPGIFGDPTKGEEKTRSYSKQTKYQYIISTI